MISPRSWVLTAMVILVAASRLLPHHLNITPVAAIALFGAATFTSRRWGFLVPLGALFLSDLVFEITYRLGWQPYWGFYRDQWVVYACFAATTLLGFTLRENKNIGRVAMATLASSLLFFVVTNFAVWAYGTAGIYPRTAAGLLLCYESALPFFRGSLAGDFFFSALLFGTFAFAESRVPALRRAAKPQDAVAAFAEV